MTQNPFEAPRANPYAQPAPQTVGGTGQIDIGEAVSQGWSAMTQNAGVAIGGTLVGLLVMMLGYITIVGIFLVLPVVGYGMVRLYLNIADGGGEVGDVFDGFRNYGSALGSMLLLFLVYLAISLPGSVLGFIGGYTDTVALVFVGQIYGFVVAFLVTMRLYFAPFFIVDQQMGAIDAVKAAWDATRDQKLMVILFSIVAGIIGAAGIIALVIGMFFTIPLSYTIYACAYRQLVGR